MRSIAFLGGSCYAHAITKSILDDQKRWCHGKCFPRCMVPPTQVQPAFDSLTNPPFAVGGGGAKSTFSGVIQNVESIRNRPYRCHFNFLHYIYKSLDTINVHQCISHALAKIPLPLSLVTMNDWYKIRSHQAKEKRVTAGVIINFLRNVSLFHHTSPGKFASEMYTSL